MNELSVVLGKRIRNYRARKKLSQEKLAELADCHPTYIGQIERGEKNATVDSISRIAAALDISLSRLFEKLSAENEQDNIPLNCYEFISTKTKSEQKQLYNILLEIDRYKSK